MKLQFFISLMALSSAINNSFASDKPIYLNSSEKILVSKYLKKQYQFPKGNYSILSNKIKIHPCEDQKAVIIVSNEEDILLDNLPIKKSDQKTPIEYTGLPGCGSGGCYYDFLLIDKKNEKILSHEAFQINGDIGFHTGTKSEKCPVFEFYQRGYSGEEDVLTDILLEKGVFITRPQPAKIETPKKRTSERLRVLPQSTKTISKLNSANWNI